jgi:sugar-specific transcriptional regulator TrmB
MDADALNLLRRAGLNQYESKVYLALNGAGPTSASDLSDLAGIPRPRTYDILDKLSKKGFIAVQPGRPTKFTAVEIKSAFASLKKKHEESFVKGLDELGQIETKLRERMSVAKPSEKPVEDFVWVLKDRGNIYSKIENLIQTAAKSITIATSEKGLRRKIDAHGELLKKARERGVKVKLIAPSHGGKRPDEYGDFIKKEHSQRVAVVDDHVVLFLTPEEHEDKKEVGAWINSPYFADCVRRSLGA